MTESAKKLSAAGVLLQQVGYEVNAPQPVRNAMFFQALTELAQRGLICHEFEICTYPNVPDYDFSSYVPDGWQVHMVKYIKYCGHCIAPIDPCDPCPHGYEMKSPSCFVMHPAPAGEQTVEVAVSILPILGECGSVPNEVVQRFSRILELRTKSLLMDMSGKSWSDTGRAGTLRYESDALMASASAADSMQYSMQTDNSPPAII